MKNHPFLKTLASSRLLLLDGAMGTMLQAAGMLPGASPETFCLTHPEILKNIHRDYLLAGSNIITTCTFGANPFKLVNKDETFSINREMAAIARAAVSESGQQGPLFVAGDVGPSGLFAKPLGNIEPEEMIAGFELQIRGLAEGGVDLIFVETQFDLAEARLAVVAARRACDLPIMVSMTFEQGASLTGSTPEIFAATMANLGCDAIGSNCSLGPDEMLPVIEHLLSVCPTPVLAEPNAGMPVLKNDKTVFPLQPEEFAQKTAPFAAMGAQILGGCCGTTPAHIKALASACAASYKPRAEVKREGVTLTSRSNIVRIGSSQPLAIIGERINPTGKAKLTSQIQQGEFAAALALADEQIAAGADVLDINVGAPLVNESEILPRLVSLLVSRQNLPLSLDSANIDAIAATLPIYPGSCLVNSISDEPGKAQNLGRLCRMFGAPAIILPLSGAKMPVKAAERIEIIEKLVSALEGEGLGRNMVLIDVLALAVASVAGVTAECLEVIKWCAAQKLATTCGLSNVSFGLPARGLLNATFLAMGAGAGLNSCIANPGAPELATTRDAIDALTCGDNTAFIAAYATWKSGNPAARQERRAETAPLTLFDAVVGGDKENVPAILEQELASGRDPFAIVNETLIPAITETGTRYEKKQFFLPQLVRSAEAMQLAVGILQPLLEKAGSQAQKPVIVMATVEGDIHDIGKNIVSLLLRNHGFEVIDAGKDVPAAQIVECAREHGARIIGLSALMTTTMARMKDTVELVKKLGLPIRIMVGGAAVTEAFAESIGANIYSDDAVSAVAAAKKLLES